MARAAEGRARHSATGVLSFGMAPSGERRWDAPISRIDLLLCRNTLMYFTAETQSRILARFNFAVCDDGLLLLGKSEMLLNHESG